MPDQQVSIRPVKPEEVQQLLLLAEKIFRQTFEHLNEPEHFEAYMSEAYTLPQFQAEMNNPESVFFFALSGSEIAGYIKLNWGAAQTDMPDQPGIELQRLYVESAFQGKQIGHQLLAFALNFGRKRHFPFLWLGVWEKNEKAIHFYEQHGLEHFGSHNFMLGRDPQTDLLMRVYLNK